MLADSPLHLRIPWRPVVLIGYVVVNVLLSVETVRLGPDFADDWAVFNAVAMGDNPYQTDTAVPFVWSPVMAPIVSAVVALGYWPWVALHVVVVFLLRAPLLIGLVLLSYGFWFDTAQGNTLTFSLVAGALALGGSRIGSLAFLVLMVLMPRPLLFPLGVWIAWKQPDTRIPFAAMIVVHASAVIASGLGVAWVEAILAYGGPDWSFGPLAWFGRWWLLAGVPIAAWLTFRGHVGLAGLAGTPYLLPQYLVWPLVELRPTAVRAERRKRGVVS